MGKLSAHTQFIYMILELKTFFCRWPLPLHLDVGMRCVF